MKIISSAIMATLVWVSTAGAETIHLNDGTELRGEIVRFSGGKYEVKTQTLGRLKINEYDIASIDYQDAQRPTVSSRRSAPAKRQPDQVTDQSSGEIQRLQLELAGNQQLMGSIAGLQNDPQIQAILSDPEIMQAVMRYDIAALQSNKKFMALLSNANIKAVTGQVTGQ